MIIKTRDVVPHTIEWPKRRAARPGEHAFGKPAARPRDEPPSRRACAFLDERFAASPEWALIHDFRLVVDGRAVRFDHLLVDDTLDVLLLDTRFIDSALYFFEHGRCESFDGVERRLVASPLDRMSRDMRALARTVRSVELPRGRSRQRLLHPVLRGGVLIDPSLRLGASIGEARGTIGVYPREALLPALRKRRLRQCRDVRERLSSEELARFAAALAMHHHPVATEASAAVMGA